MSLNSNKNFVSVGESSSESSANEWTPTGLLPGKVNFDVKRVVTVSKSNKSQQRKTEKVELSQLRPSVSKDKSTETEKIPTRQQNIPSEETHKKQENECGNHEKKGNKSSKKKNKKMAKRGSDLINLSDIAGVEKLIEELVEDLQEHCKVCRPNAHHCKVSNATDVLNRFFNDFGKKVLSEVLKHRSCTGVVQVLKPVSTATVGCQVEPTHPSVCVACQTEKRNVADEATQSDNVEMISKSPDLCCPCFVA